MLLRKYILHYITLHYITLPFLGIPIGTRISCLMNKTRVKKSLDTVPLSLKLIRQNFGKNNRSILFWQNFVLVKFCQNFSEITISFWLNFGKIKLCFAIFVLPKFHLGGGTLHYCHHPRFERYGSFIN